tara:strand:+ start:537 stop:1022 length:486 start_codon:yes stop_codon:yes gene_type:complete
MELRKNIRDYIKINPIDLQSKVAVGIPFPFNAEGVFNLTYTTKEQIKSNLLNVLLTEPGERVFKPNFGVGLRRFLFENIIETSVLEEQISAQINLHIREIELTRVNASKAIDSAELKITILYRMISNNASDVIQINFNTDINQNNSTTGIPTGTAIGSVGY